ncbi:COL12A1 [Acrasis kona]|uniref:COL12A1 n=1 Tax=Acrasis kona TaxID=1008807 RepID=A0AAW2ZCN2_9EUKA
MFVLGGPLWKYFVCIYLIYTNAYSQTLELAEAIQLEGKVNFPNRYIFYQTTFTQSRPTHDVEVYFKVEPCSGTSPLAVYVRNNNVPSQSEYDDVSIGRSVMYLKAPWTAPMSSYLGIRSNETLRFKVEAHRWKFTTIEIVNPSIELTRSIEGKKYFVIVTWKVPNDRGSPYKYRVSYTTRGETDWCNMMTECGVEECGKHFTDEYQDYKPKDGVISQAFQLDKNTYESDLRFQVIVKSDFNVVAAYSTADLTYEEASRLPMIIILVLIPIFIVLIVGSVLSVVLYRKFRRRREIYNVVY